MPATPPRQGVSERAGPGRSRRSVQRQEGAPPAALQAVQHVLERLRRVEDRLPRGRPAEGGAEGAQRGVEVRRHVRAGRGPRPRVLQQQTLPPQQRPGGPVELLRPAPERHPVVPREAVDQDGVELAPVGRGDGGQAVGNLDRVGVARGEPEELRCQARYPRVLLDVLQRQAPRRTAVEQVAGDGAAAEPHEKHAHRAAGG
mmetsp:Transcript_107460/g.291318  ORF Transcript_107460/g.291318 Transcript_107460/m.291318 type:complete len:201 (+) Transcript_107460:20-622(+)